MTTYISVANPLFPMAPAVGVKGGSKGQVFRKLVQMGLAPNEYNIVELSDNHEVPCGHEVPYRAQYFLIKFKDKYINVNHIIWMEAQNVCPPETTRNYYVYGEGLYILKIKMVAGDEVFGFKTPDERREFVEMVDKRLYDINTYRRTCEGGC